MTEIHQDHNHKNNRRITIGFIGFAVIAAFFLLSEHRAHMLGFLPWIILIFICPLLHMFMHGGHKHRGDLGPGAGVSDIPGKIGNDPSATSGLDAHNL